MKVSKKQAQRLLESSSEQRYESVPESGTEVYHKEIVIEGKRAELEKTSAPERGDLPERCALARTRGTQRSATARKRRATKSEASATLAAEWALYVREFFPKDTPLTTTKASATILRQYRERWEACNGAGVFLDYLRWVVEYWTRIGEVKFYWMVDFPKVPTLRLLLTAKFQPLFEDAYRVKRKVEALAKLPPLEREATILMERRGLSWEEALEAVSRVDEYEAERKHLQARARQLDGRERALLARERLPGKSAARLPDFKDKPVGELTGPFDEWNDDE